MSAEQAKPQQGSTQHDNTQPSGAASLRFDNWGYRHASRRNFAVRGLSLDIPAGQKVLILGASGIGKSTMLEGAAGLLGGAKGIRSDTSEAQHEPSQTVGSHAENASAEELHPHQTQSAGASTDKQVNVQAVVDEDGGVSEGSVLVDGVPVQQARGRVGLVLQDPDAQVIFQRLGDNVAFGPENLNVERHAIWDRVRTSLQAVGLEGLQLHRSTTHLSGGQTQRLALAGALAMQPGVLLLDEPTANLDPDGVEQIVDAVKDVVDRTGATMVLVEHHAQPWVEMLDRVIVLGVETNTGDADETGHGAQRRTVIVADGSPDDVFMRTDIDFASLGIWLPRIYIDKRHESAGKSMSDRQQTSSNDQAAQVSDAAACEGEVAHDDSPKNGDTDNRWGEILVTTQNLAIGRNGQAIASDINIALAAGEVTALVGANGAGKSTLSLTLAGLLPPVSGSVQASQALADGLGVEPMSWKSRALASRISYVFQNPEHQFATGSVLDEVMLGPIRTGMSQEDAKRRAESLLSRFRLDRYAKANPYTLSGGEKRRLTVAAALAAAPRLLILDEPTFGQDRNTWMQMVELIRSLRNDGVGIVVVTHDRELVRELQARVIELLPEHQSGVWDQRLDASEQAQGESPMLPAKADLPVVRAIDEDADDSEDVEQALSCTADDASVPGMESILVSEVNRRDEEPRQSSRSPVLASMNPAYRLIGAFAASLPLLLSLDWMSASVALGLEFLVLMAMGLMPWRVIASTWPVFIGAPGSALAVLLYGKSGGEIWWQWGWILISERSATLALATALRILAIGIPAIITIAGVDATDLADSFSQVLHLPDRFVYGGLAGMRLFSVLQDDWAALTASRRSRGLGEDGKVRSFFPQAFALLVLSIRRSTTLAVAMEARGFGGSGPRSHARISEVRLRDRIFVVGCLCVPVIALCVAGVTGHFAFFGG